MKFFAPNKTPSSSSAFSSLRVAISTAMLATMLATVLGAMSAGCDASLSTDGGPEPDANDAGSSDDGGIGDAGIGVPEVGSEVYMGPGTLLDVDITMDPSDFAALRLEARDYFNTFSPGCLTRNWKSPFNKYSADVTIDGIEGYGTQAFTNVSIRKKGFFGSVVADKPSFKIRFDKHDDTQRLFGEKRLTLNNQNQDSSLVRTCLAYHVFESAGVPVPRCNFALVHVNGERMGVYVNVDSIKKPLLRRHFDDDSGNLYEGTLSDFRTEWRGTFEKKSNATDVTTPEIDDMIAALAADDASLMAALDAILDIDAFYTFWATETLVSHWDGYSGNTNNFYLYGNPLTSKIEFIPWGPDGSFQGPFLLFEDTLAPDSVMASGYLTRRLYAHPEGRAGYLARLDEILTTVWDEVALVEEIDRQFALISPVLEASEVASVQAGVDEVIAFVDARRGLIEAEVSQGPIEWDVPLREGICLPEYGDVTFSFSTTWGTHPAPGFNYSAQGDAEISGTLLGEELVVDVSGSGAGLEQNGEKAGWPVVLVTAAEDGAPTNFFYFQIEPTLAVPGAILDVDGQSVLGFHFVVVPAFDVLSGIYEGTLTLDAFSTVDGAPVSGSFVGKLAGDTGE